MISVEQKMRRQQKSLLKSRIRIINAFIFLVVAILTENSLIHMVSGKGTSLANTLLNRKEVR